MVRQPAGFGEGRANDPVSDPCDQAIIFRMLDELAGIDQAALWMNPAQQGFAANHFMRMRINLRLEVELEFVSFQG